MIDSPFTMRFDPRTIKHLGVRMYSTLPPALAEIISNAYDADASEVTVTLREKDSKPVEIIVSDNGDGLALDEINSKFLVIGRNRRDDDGDKPSDKFKRKRIGKKGLGKLALFGLAKTITISTRQGGLHNVFVLDWDDLNAAEGDYKPKVLVLDEPTEEPDGTDVSLTGLKRKSQFEPEALADSLSRVFIVDKNFDLGVQLEGEERISINNERRYKTLDVQFEWDIADAGLIDADSEFSGKLTGRLITSAKPITPSSGLRGITLFSRQKLVNAPEYFSASASSHFYQYLTGWISVDFIDDLPDDVIATNRQALDWDHPEISALRTCLSSVVSKVNSEWRARRKTKKNEELTAATGIDTNGWLNKVPENLRLSVQKILDNLGGEDALDSFTPVVKALHDIIPEYPLLHWRHLHPEVRDRVKDYYQNGQYGDAASQGVQIYCEFVRNLTGLAEDGASLVNRVFGSKPFTPPPQLQLNDLSTDSKKNIQEGQGHLSRGVVTGFRNPISHAPIDSSVPGVFSELDCLNILSLVSYLLTRLDNVTVNPTVP